MATGTQAGERSAEGAARVALVEDSFRHEALFYSGARGFLQGTLPFVAEALGAGEPVLVAVGEHRAGPLRAALGEDGERVQFLPAEALVNPARAIPLCLQFLDRHPEQTCSARGICEVTWPGRSSAELEECARHEALLNTAFAQGPSWRLLCPYDLDALSAEAIAVSRKTHSTLLQEGAGRRNGPYEPRHRAPGPFVGSLASPPPECEGLAFTSGGLGAVRSHLAQLAGRAGLAEVAREDLVLAVNELVTNSVQYGGGGGTLYVWQESREIVCEVRDRGFIEDPLAGRVPPPVDQYGGRGLWLVNQLCDLVQIRSSPEGTAVRVRVRTSPRPDWR